MNNLCRGCRITRTDFLATNAQCNHEGSQEHVIPDETTINERRKETNWTLMATVKSEKDLPYIVPAKDGESFGEIMKRAEHFYGIKAVKVTSVLKIAWFDK